MILIADLIRLLAIENELIHDQTNGLTQEDTLIQPQPSGNCMNWVLGHTLESQITMLTVLGGTPPFDTAEVERYKRESEPIRAEEPGLLSLERLLEGHDQIHKAIAAQLGKMSDADFAEEILYRGRQDIRGWRVFFLHFHYTYHLGQLELLRQMAGKTDKIV